MTDNPLDDPLYNIQRQLAELDAQDHFGLTSPSWKEFFQSKIPVAAAGPPPLPNQGQLGVGRAYPVTGQGIATGSNPHPHPLTVQGASNTINPIKQTVRITAPLEVSEDILFALKKPNEDMIRAGGAAYKDFGFPSYCPQVITAIYEAMIKACVAKPPSPES